jgi:hypothetical protein
LFYNAVDVACDELEARILISRAALIVEGYPTVEIHVFVFAVEHRDVVGFPGDALGEVGRLDLLRRSAAVFQQPNQGRLRDQIVGDVGEDQIVRLAREDAATKLVDDALIRAEYGDGNFHAIFENGDLFADELFEQLLGRKQIVLIVLFENLQAGRIG